MSRESFLSKNISGFTGALESIIAAEDLCRAKGFLQSLDSRVKVFSFVMFIVSVGLLRDFWLLLIIFPVILSLALLSKIPAVFFLKRILLFIPIFTLVIAIPALFITPGNTLWAVGSHTVITEQGLRAAGFLVLRVTDSLSLSVLLILTTPWNNLLAALRWFRIPAVLVDILGMTYRYIYLLLHNTNAMFWARRSRTLGSFSASENRRWLGRALTTTLLKTNYLSESVYMAMLSRGYQGEIHLLESFKMRRRDWWWLFFITTAGAILIAVSYGL